MQKTYWILFMCIFWGFGSQAQSEDEGIKACINNYFEGLTKGDTAKLNKAFHASALLKTFNTQAGRVQDFPVKTFISKTPAGGVQANTRIVSYSYSGVAASAAVELTFTDFKYMDLLSMLKVGGEWKIVCRVFSRGELGASFVSPYGNASAPAPAAPAAKKPAAKKPKSDDGWD
jgi:Putative lumazine-binding